MIWCGRPASVISIFVIWKEWLELSIWACGLYGHLDGTAIKPDGLPMRPEGTTLTADKVSEIERHTKNLSQYLQDQAIVFQQIASTVMNSSFLLYMCSHAFTYHFSFPFDMCLLEGKHAFHLCLPCFCIMFYMCLPWDLHISFTYLNQ